MLRSIERVWSNRLQYNELGDDGATLLFGALERNATVLSIG